MATRRTVIEVTTQVLLEEFDHVSNKFYTADELMDRPDRYTIFPWWIVAMGQHDVEFSLDGSLEVEATVPVVCVGYCITEGEDLQIELADLADRFIATVKAGSNTFTENCFGFTGVTVNPFEDEIRRNVGTLYCVLNAITGN